MPASEYLSEAQHAPVRRPKRLEAHLTKHCTPCTSGGLAPQFGHGFYAGGPGWWGENTFVTDRDDVQGGGEDGGDGGGGGGDGGE